MTNTNCPNCDKPDCAVDKLAHMHEAAWQQSPFDANAYHHIRELREDAERACLANAVNWRSRALTEAARADAAEARVASALELVATYRQMHAQNRSDVYLGQKVAADAIADILEPKP